MELKDTQMPSVILVDSKLRSANIFLLLGQEMEVVRCNVFLYFIVHKQISGFHNRVCQEM